MALLLKDLGKALGAGAETFGKVMGQNEILKQRDERLSSLRKDEAVHAGGIAAEAATVADERAVTAATVEDKRQTDRETTAFERERDTLLPGRADEQIRVAEAGEENKIRFETVRKGEKDVKEIYRGTEKVAEIGSGFSDGALRAKASGTKKNVGDEEKMLYKMSAAAFGSQLGDDFSFGEGEADKAAVAAELALNHWRNTPEGQRNTLTSFRRALEIMREQKIAPITDIDALTAQVQEQMNKETPGLFAKAPQEKVEAEVAAQLSASRGSALLPGAPPVAQAAAGAGATAGLQAGSAGSSRNNPIPITKDTKPEEIPSGTWFKTPDGRVMQKK